jgi:putative ABC transport system permease protein
MTLVPLSYNLRSMRVRATSTLLTIFSIAATVAVLASLLSLQQGFATMFSERGRDDVMVFLRPGASSEGQSGFPRDRADILIKGTPEIAEGPDGQPLASAELFLAVRRFKLDGGETNVPIRGVQPASFAIHGEDFQIIEGQRFGRGTDELIVGRRLVDRIADCALGDELMLNTTPFRVVGVFASKGPHESEIWGDADRLMEALERPVFNRVIGVLRENADVPALIARLKEDRRVPAKAMTEREYLTSQTSTLSAVFIGLGLFLGAVMGIGAIFTGTNSMLASISARTREIGILLSIGFRPWALFVSFLFESTVIGILGGVVGCLFVVPLNGIQTGTMNFQTFSEIAFAFRITPIVLISAVGFAMLLGLLGGAIPAWRAARMKPTEALRRA